MMIHMAKLSVVSISCLFLMPNDLSCHRNLKLIQFKWLLTVYFQDGPEITCFGREIFAEATPQQNKYDGPNAMLDFAPIDLLSRHRVYFIIIAVEPPRTVTSQQEPCPVVASFQYLQSSLLLYI